MSGNVFLVFFLSFLVFWSRAVCVSPGGQVQLAGIDCAFHEKFHPISKMICVPNNSEKGNPDFSSSSPFPKNHPS